METVKWPIKRNIVERKFLLNEKQFAVSSNGGTSFFLSIEEFILFESKDERGGKRESFNEEPCDG